MATDTTVKKVSSSQSPTGPEGQAYLVSGKNLSMRLWRADPKDESRPRSRSYETVGYVIEGRAELTLEGQLISLEPGDSWLVPADVEHAYKIVEPLVAVEATSPPARVHGRDEI